MYRHIVAGLMALSLTSAPAQALTEDEVGKLLFGLAALAAIGAIVDNADNGSVEVTRTHRPAPQVRQPRRTVLPRACLRGYETRFGTHRMFGARCLRNSYAFATDLPRACAVRIFTNDGPRRGFDPACLRGRGYTARR